MNVSQASVPAALASNVARPKLAICAPTIDSRARGVVVLIPKFPVLPSMVSDAVDEVAKMFYEAKNDPARYDAYKLITEKLF